MIKFKEYKINELFDPSNGNFDIQQCHINNKGYFVVSSGLQNCGIIGKTDVNARIFDKNTITIDMFGNVFFRDFEYKMVTHARVFSIKYKYKKLKCREGMYLATVLKYIKKLFSYDKMATWEKVKNLKILIPINKDNNIDYDYMEERIRELEEERIRELTAYLTVSGYKDCKLTSQEEKTINDLNNNKIEFKEFNITGKNGIFDVKNTHSILQEWIVPNSGNVPYVTAGVGNNSITTYITPNNQEWVEKGHSIMIGGKTLVITYQEQDYVSNDSHNLALYLKNDKICSENVYLFLVAALYKSLKPKYEWGDSISKTKIQKDIIKLPINDKNEIDFDFMETYISAIKKLTIKNVVDWRDKQINTTKQVVNNT